MTTGHIVRTLPSIYYPQSVTKPTHLVEIMKAILPEESQEEIPVGFSIVGHVAHLNLRSQYLPYKHLIASVLLDKNPSVKTVINKTDDVGTSSAYRTFSYEVLAGLDDMNVEIREEDCVFRFDYSKVYWNSRLNTEHRRLVELFRPGEVVVDVMAGVGPFAVPAGRKGVFVWANDLNPDSYGALRDAVVRNKVGLWVSFRRLCASYRTRRHMAAREEQNCLFQIHIFRFLYQHKLIPSQVEPFVRPFNLDGHAFIPHAAADLLHLHSTGKNTITLPSKAKRSRNTSPSEPPPPPTTITIPPTISHFVMNLPASAISFLPAFHGLYAGHEKLFEPYTQTKLPMVHVHCFSTKSEDNVREGRDICERISESLGVRVVPAGEGRGVVKDGVEGEAAGRGIAETETEVEIHDVRDVAPLKRMFCASFKLPGSVAFAKRREEKSDVVGCLTELSL
jgi:tRNA (guanine37-N1)-methyltransferase